MNRTVARISALCLCAALATPLALASKKKKKVDLAANPLADVKSKQPDKELFDKAMLALKKGKYDVARLDLQTLLNTYPDTEYAMRAKLAIGDTWYKEGGSAALEQAESEYKDFITFFPNTPEAAEAQMKVGDIYYQQMEKPDRDPQNAEHAEQEYRTMLEQFPDSSLIPRAKQRLRDVQEVLAQRQYEIGQYYVTRENWAAAIARLQTVADSYPLFSHSDDTLIALGDAYATEAQIASHLNISPKAKEELVRLYDNQAAQEWDRVVTRYPMAAHVEDAKDRLIAMGRPVPDPTPQALAESEAEEASRVNVRIKDRAMLLVGHGPSTVQAARVGEPTLNDPAPVLAPTVTKQTLTAFNDAIRGVPIPGAATAPGNSAEATAIANGTAPPRTGSPAAAAPQLEDVPAGAGDNGVAVEVVNPGASSNSGGGAGDPNGAGNTAAPAVNIAAPPPPPPASPVVKAVGPSSDASALPPVDKPAPAPDQINDVKSGGAQVNTGATASNKKKKAPYNSKQESSSQHKKKKGLDKLNPF